MIAAAHPWAPGFSWLARQPQTAAAWPPALPTQVFSCTALAHAYMMTPKRPNDTGIMQVCCGRLHMSAAAASCGCKDVLPAPARFSEYAARVPTASTLGSARLAAGGLRGQTPSWARLADTPAARPAPAVQAWLQEFAWTEEELPKRLRERQSTLAHADSSRHTGGQQDKAALMAELAKEPMFCFEVCLAVE